MAAAVGNKVGSEGYRGFLWGWALLALAPAVAYAEPLWQQALADTPVAYLVWIPVLAVAWAAVTLATTPHAYPDDREVDLLVGGGALLLVGGILALGPRLWPVTLVGHAMGLLLWPAWALGMAWLWFGVGITRRLVAPLAYWLLAWPPVFQSLVDPVQGTLVAAAIRGLEAATRWVPWLRTVDAATGTFVVAHRGHWVPVIVAQACSGADSLLGAAILLPLFLTLWKGPVPSRLAMVAVALAGALVSNWLRLGVLVGAVHVFGSGFTFGVLHPSLGFLFFAALGLTLMALARPLGLLAEPWPARPLLALPSRRRCGLGGALSLGLFAALLPVWSLPAGSLGRPVTVPTTAIDAFFPELSGFGSKVTYRANESSVLGPGSATVAELYTSPHGAEALAEIWMTPDFGRLEAYGFQDCLLYHGSAIVHAQSLTLSTGNPATLYVVAMAPDKVGGPRPTYVDIEWEGAVKGPAGVRYLRWSLAAFPAAKWPTQPGRPAATAVALSPTLAGSLTLRATEQALVAIADRLALSTAHPNLSDSAAVHA
ncbi:MAG: exosortase/archaeosortase family protein [Firmicutes bacterium]|nr:exosortase/archaeosortase family protein [Alicyclobacillaceae bacterium]MCL6497248.1 exosortase/archaeosortase family protein [Bacillota bacterium]